MIYIEYLHCLSRYLKIDKFERMYEEWKWYLKVVQCKSNILMLIKPILSL